MGVIGPRYVQGFVYRGSRLIPSRVWNISKAGRPDSAALGLHHSSGDSTGLTPVSPLCPAIRGLGHLWQFEML